MRQPARSRDREAQLLTPLRSLILHLAPWALVTASVWFAAPLSSRIGLPPHLGVLLLLPLAILILLLAYLVYQGYRRLGRLSLAGIVLYRRRPPLLQTVVLASRC